MKRTRLATALLIPLLMTACGDDSDSTDDAPEETLPADEAAVRDALVASFFDPSCDLLTEDYLLEKAILSETAEEACAEHENSWVEPQYDEDDVLVTDIEIEGDVATANVGSELIDLTTAYELRLVDGTWLVNCDSFSCDRLDEPTEEPSAEVS